MIQAKNISISTLSPIFHIHCCVSVKIAFRFKNNNGKKAILPSNPCAPSLKIITHLKNQLLNKNYIYTCICLVFVKLKRFKELKISILCTKPLILSKK
ncbi:hypothetical protein, partial [Aequorivita sp. 609]|uniref:hypothetical protein n=1 Tax=Aequorivita sp. 609 TaxID=2760087 RepID=UPI001C87DA02